MPEQNTKNQSGVATLPKTRVREPQLYQVLLVNDDYTTMEFVITVLQRYFHKPLADATRIMMSVHQQGRGVCGVFPHDIAATKVVQVTEYARQHEMPLRCDMERA